LTKEKLNMKYIIAVIQPDRLQETLDELENQEIHLVTVTQVVGRGNQKGLAEVYRGHKEAGSLLRKVKIEIAVNEEFAEKAVTAISSAAKTGDGSIGDGKIFVLDLHDCVRIRTGERGDEAIGA
jgi:nitrogen regulatory protein P-II 1